MRLIIAAAIMLAAVGGARAGQCIGQEDEAAFAVHALKSEMMLAAVGCRAQVRYNAVIRRFKGDILAQENRVAAWFGRAYGNGGRARYDDYVSELANVQSLTAVRELGDDFCKETLGVFGEAMKLKKGSELAMLANGKGYPQPEFPPRCTAVVAAAQRSPEGPAGGNLPPTAMHAPPD